MAELVDVRAPRFGAAITAALLLCVVILDVATTLTIPQREQLGWFAYQPLANAVFLPGGYGVHRSTVERVSEPAFVLLVVIWALFLWGVASPRTQPWAVLFRRVVAPRRRPAEDFEDPRPPRFAQAVGLFVVTVGLVLHLVGVPFALAVAAGAAFVAAFLNAAFGVCLGCMLYLALQRLRRRRGIPSAQDPR